MVAVGVDNNQSGNNRNLGGGGGGVEFLDKTVNYKWESHRVAVGAGGASDNNGGNSIFKSNADQVVILFLILNVPER